MSQNQTHMSDLPDDVVLRVSGVSKKFCRNLRRSMWYGIQDLSKTLMGFRSNPETADCRLQTADFSGGCASGKTDTGQEIGRIEDPKSLQSAVCGLQSDLRPSEFWALRDISFDLKRGECLGLIGRNGCGKTTLLRLIAGIFPPDRGKIAIRGRAWHAVVPTRHAVALAKAEGRRRLGALIALGAGFHPYMTGRENFYLNGAISL